MTSCFDHVEPAHISAYERSSEAPPPPLVSPAGSSPHRQRLHALHRHHLQSGVRPPARRRVLVHGGHRVDHRALLHHLRPAGQRGHQRPGECASALRLPVYRCGLTCDVTLMCPKLSDDQRLELPPNFLQLFLYMNLLCASVRGSAHLPRREPYVGDRGQI